jgi:hypothetical protein
LIEVLVLQLDGCIGENFSYRSRIHRINGSGNRFAYAILAADEIVAIANTIAFKYGDGITYLNWVVGREVDAAVWIALFLVIVVSINMLPVKVDTENSLVQKC